MFLYINIFKNSNAVIVDSDFTEHVALEHRMVLGNAYIFPIEKIYKQRKLNIPYNLFRYYLNNYSEDSFRTFDIGLLLLNNINQEIKILSKNQKLGLNTEYNKYHPCIVNNLWQFCNIYKNRKIGKFGQII